MMAESNQINWGCHPDPPSIWFSSEKVFNKYVCPVNFTEYFTANVDKFKNKDNVNNKDKVSNSKSGTETGANEISIQKSNSSKINEQQINRKYDTEEVAQEKKAGHGTKCNKPPTKQLPTEFLEFASFHQQTSLITKNDMKVYLDNLNVYSASVQKQKPNHLKEIEMKIKQEQSLFQNHLRNFARKDLSRYLYINHDFKTMFEQSIKNEMEIEKEKFKDTYDLEKTVSLTSGVAFQNDPLMQHVGTIHNEGIIPALNILNQQSVLDVEQLEDTLATQNHDLWNQDDLEVMKEFAMKNNVDIIISASSLLELINNHPPGFTKAWKIPIEIMHIEKENVSRNLVIISDPLPPSKLTTRDANFILYRKVLKKTMQNLSQGIRIAGCDGRKEEASVCINSASGEDASRENEALQCRKDSLSAAAKTGAAHPDAKNDGMFNNGTMSLDDEKQRRNVPRDGSTSDGNTACSPASNAEKPTLTEEKQKISRDYNNVQYDVWKLGKLTLLVRSNFDGYAIKNQNSSAIEKIVYKIFPKIEYQAAFGVEEFSVSEITTAWWECFLSKNSHLLCVRINPKNNEVLRSDAYEYGNILGPSCPFRPKSSMKLLHNILKEILKQNEPGKLMMVHKTTEMHACLYRSKKQVKTGKDRLQTGYNPFSDCQLDTTDWLIGDNIESWLPIDTNIILDIYKELDQVPCLFPQPEQCPVPDRSCKMNNKRKKKANAKRNSKKNKKALQNVLKNNKSETKCENQRKIIENYEEMDF